MRRPITLAVAITAGLLVAGLAAADHRRDALEEVRLLAHELEDATRELAVLARRLSHHYDRGERHALSDLYELDNRARHFHREVESRWRDPRHTLSDYRELHRAVDHAMRQYARLHPLPPVERAMWRVDRLMLELDRYFGFYTSFRCDLSHGYGHSRWDEHRRYDEHGRYGDHGRYGGRGHGRYAVPRFRFEWRWWD